MWTHRFESCDDDIQATDTACNHACARQEASAAEEEEAPAEHAKARAPQPAAAGQPVAEETAAAASMAAAAAAAEEPLASDLEASNPLGLDPLERDAYERAKAYVNAADGLLEAACVAAGVVVADVDEAEDCSEEEDNWGPKWPGQGKAMYAYACIALMHIQAEEYNTMQEMHMPRNTYIQVHMRMRWRMHHACK